MVSRNTGEVGDANCHGSALGVIADAGSREGVRTGRAGSRIGDGDSRQARR